jgi:serine/threonine protein kinase
MTAAVDMWGIGVICYIMLSGFHPIQEKEQTKYFDAIATAKYSFDYPEWKDKSKASIDFVSKLLQADAENRMSAKEALQHPWIQV